jgi:hypothetical protein
LRLEGVIAAAYDAHEYRAGRETELGAESGGTGSRVQPDACPIDGNDIMIRYEPPRYHVVFGIAAVAMMALTFALAVGIPAEIAPSAPDTMAQAAKGLSTAVTGVVIIPAIEVVGERETNVAGRLIKPRG